MRRALFIVAALLIATPASALDTLLLEVRWQFPEPADPPAWYGFSFGGGPMFGGIVDYGCGDDRRCHPGFVTEIPAEQTADTATLTNWNTGVMDRFTMRVMEYADGEFIHPDLAPYGLWFTPGTWQEGYVYVGLGDTNPPQGTWTVTPHAPQLGVGLRGYQLTHATRSIDATSQTVRMYGIPTPPVPEPAAIALVAILHFSILGFRAPARRPCRSE